MSEQIYERIKQDPRFHDLQKRRGKFSVYLSLSILIVYYGFVLIVGFAPELLAKPIADGFTTTIGIPIGAAIIIFSWITTGIYVKRANSEFDQLNKEIVEEASK